MDSKESIPLRLAKLNQQIDGKVASSTFTSAVSRDGLLDSLLALYDECERRVGRKQKNPSKHITNFVHKGELFFTLYNKLSE